MYPCAICHFFILFLPNLGETVDNWHIWELLARSIRELPPKILLGTLTPLLHNRLVTMMVKMLYFIHIWWVLTSHSHQLPFTHFQCLGFMMNHQFSIGHILPSSRQWGCGLLWLWGLNDRPKILRCHPTSCWAGEGLSWTKLWALGQHHLPWIWCIFHHREWWFSSSNLRKRKVLGSCSMELGLAMACIGWEWCWWKG